MTFIFSTPVREMSSTGSSELLSLRMDPQGQQSKPSFVLYLCDGQCRDNIVSLVSPRLQPNGVFLPRSETERSPQVPLPRGFPILFPYLSPPEVHTWPNTNVAPPGRSSHEIAGIPVSWESRWVADSSGSPCPGDRRWEGM